MLYPIVGERAQGARTWDIDGNEYIDITMGFGVNLFGHHPPFIIEALEQQLHKTMQLGLQTTLAGQVAQLICELTGMERVTFCNTGTEAVMTALRLARTATNRHKIVQFTMSYHGHFDGTLGEAQAEPESLSTLPIAPGVTPNTVADTWVLDYGEPQSLELIRAHADEVAAVLVEPVQSRRPDLQPKAFLQQLRQLTLELNIPLIFDEMITGFRVHPGGAQAWFGVQADIATYGKIVGGGMPIGIIAGKATYMDGIDGGFWNYGDASYPQANTTFFAGTFGKHPLAMATSLATLEQIKQQGPALQERLNQRTTYLVETLNDYFEKQEMPIRLAQFSSLFRFTYSSNLDLLYYHLLEKGIYVWEGRNCFLSTAHTDEDIKYIIKAVKESVNELRQGGFLPPTSPNPHPKKAQKDEKDKKEPVQPAKKPAQPAIERKPNYSMAKLSLAKQPLPDYLLTPIEIKDRLTPQMEQWSSQFGIKEYSKAISQMERLSIAYVLNAFQNMGWQFEAKKRFSTARMANQLNVIESHHRLLNRLLEMLAEEGWLHLANEQWEVVHTPQQEAPNHLALLEQYPMAEAELTLLNRCGEQLAQVLRGECDPLQLLFPNGDLSTATQLYQTSPLTRWINTLAQKTMSEALTRLPDDREVRILEVGAGTGGTTAYLLPHLPARQTLYVFSDLSTWFTAQAQKKFSAHPFVCYHLLDIEQDPQAQGFDLQSFDLIIAANVLHATEDLQCTVQHVQQLLAPGGLLILLEGTEKQRWVDLIFGLTEGWWKFTDHALCPAYPLLSASQWQELLLANGFTDVIAFVPTSPGQVEQVVLVAEKSRRIPLLEAQKQLWVLSKMDNVGAQVAYNSYLSLQLNGVLNLTALRQAVQQVVNRHQALRTVFESDGEFQYCLPELNLDVPLIDCTEFLRTATTPAQIDEILATTFFEPENRQPFDLVSGPLIRVQVLKLSEQRHLLVLTIHHIISDGISMVIIANEIGTFYSAQCQGTKCLRDTPLQLSDYIQWQTQQIETQEMAVHRDYWLNIFSDSIPVLQLPIDRPYPAIRTYQGSKQSLNLPGKLYSNLKNFSRQQACTPFMTLLAAYMTWLYRISGQTDLVVGIPVAGRNLDNGESLVGYCTHLLPIITQIDGKMSFTAYLQTLRSVLLSAYEHQDYPFANLIEQLKLHRDPSHPPLVSATFNLDKPSVLSELSGLEVAWYPQPVLHSAFDLSFNFIEFGEKILLDCTYNTDVFLPATIERLIANFQMLLNGIADDPTRSLYQLPLLTQTEIRQLMEWNQTETDYPKDKTIVNLFEEQVEKTPDNIAVVFEGQQLTYAELNRRANKLAHYLRTLICTANDLIAICVERSLDMIIGLLGILKAGGVYVPLDPEYPQERLGYMLEDSQASLLLTQSWLQDHLPATDTRIIYFDELEVFDRQQNDNLAQVVGPSDLAYVIYTSGSTGAPKGVCIPHRAVVRLVKNTDYAVFDADQVFLQYAPVSFDAATLEIWGALLHGAKLVVMPHDQKTLDVLATVLQQENITLLWLTSSLFNVMLEEFPTSLQNVKQLLTGGEALSVPHIQKGLRQLPDTQLVNGYGPTENTTFTCCYPIHEQNYGASIPIGKPIANTQVFIVDKYHQVLPIGCIGELVTGGAGLARGYLNRSELTAEKFIEIDLFGTKQRVYKTGDLACWLPDGNLEYIGRMDYQVKLRGFRIELGEIESVLVQHEAIKEAVVVLHEREDNKSLAAYLTTHDDQLIIDNSSFIPDLRAWLKDTLPDYMVPAHFMVLDKLPLTPNGKIDRKALPDLDTSLSTSQYEPPSNETEQKIAAIWAQILQHENLSIYDSFFEIGGHSLLLIRIHRLLQADYPTLNIVDLFNYPTIHSLAQYINQYSDVTRQKKAETAQARGEKRRAQQQTTATHQWKKRRA
jgi:amino acid adenylation domain-containing protein